MGWVLGLLMGLLASSLTLSANYTLLLCSGLNLIAFVLSIFLVADPLLIFERRLVGIERKIDFTYRGIESASNLMDGRSSGGILKQDNFIAFGIALMFFMLASSILFTPLPIFFEQELNFSSTEVFLVYVLNSGGSLLGYFIAGRKSVFSS